MNSDKRGSKSRPIEVDLVAIYYAFRERVGLFAIGMGIAMLAGVIYLLVTPKEYRSQALLQVDQTQPRVVKFDMVGSEDLGSLESLRTIEQTLASAGLLTRLVTNSGAELDREALGLDANASLTNDDIVSALAKRLDVRLIRGTRLISVEAEARTAQAAGAIPKLLIREYTKSVLESHAAVTRDANNFLIGESERLRRKLEASRQKLQEFRERTGAVSIDDSRNLVDARLRELSTTVTEAKSKRLGLEADAAQVQALGTADADALLNMSSLASQAAVLEQKKHVAAQEAEIANLTERYLPKHPKMIQAQARLAELRQGLNRVIATAAEGIATTLEAARATEEKLNVALREQEEHSLRLSRVAIEYDALAREVEADNTLYEAVLRRMKETEVTGGLGSEVIRVVQESTPPRYPSEPRTALVLALCAMAGLMLGGLATLGTVALDRSIKTVDEGEAVLGLPALASVQRDRVPAAKLEEMPIIREQHGAVAENFRSLRTSIALLGAAEERSRILFTSAIPDEGKSYCAINYAIALAQQGLRTLLIDADLRKPALALTFFGKRDLRGLADVLMQRTDLASAVRTSSVPNLDVLPAGDRLGQPAELLALSSFEQVLLMASAEYDRIVIDTAPVNAVSDTLLLVHAVDSVCLVVRAGKSSRKAVSRALDALSGAGADIAGFVLNGLPRNSGRDYHYHYSVGSYGEGVYGAASES